MKIDISCGELGTVRALVFLALVDARARLAGAGNESSEWRDRFSDEVRHLEVLLEKLDSVPFGLGGHAVDVA